MPREAQSCVSETILAVSEGLLADLRSATIDVRVNIRRGGSPQRVRR
jgi:hypothetical protein